MNRMALVRLIAAASAPSRPDASPGERRGAVPSLAPGVSIIVPLLGGARSLESSLRSLLALEHPGTEILVIDDGRDAASRETIGSLAASSDGRLRAFRRVGATRSEALNLGLRIARHPLVLCIDAGSTLARLDTATPGRFHETGVAALFGVDGAWRAPGPAALFRRAALVGAGGFSEAGDARAADAELAVRLVAAGHEVVFDPSLSAVADGSAGPLARFRRRYGWSRGAVRAWRRLHRSAASAPVSDGDRARTSADGEFLVRHVPAVRRDDPDGLHAL